MSRGVACGVLNFVSPLDGQNHNGAHNRNRQLPVSCCLGNLLATHENYAQTILLTFFGFDNRNGWFTASSAALALRTMLLIAESVQSFSASFIA